MQEKCWRGRASRSDTKLILREVMTVIWKALIWLKKKKRGCEELWYVVYDFWRRVAPFFSLCHVVSIFILLLLWRTKIEGDKNFYLFLTEPAKVVTCAMDTNIQSAMLRWMLLTVCLKLFFCCLRGGYCAASSLRTTLSQPWLHSHLMGNT